jgi:hypothetical protein
MNTHEPPGLFAAVYAGDEDAVVRLLRSGASPESVDGDGQTALYLAAGAAPDLEEGSVAARREACMRVV